MNISRGGAPLHADPCGGGAGGGGGGADVYMSYLQHAAQLRLAQAALTALPPGGSLQNQWPGTSHALWQPAVDCAATPVKTDPLEICAASDGGGDDGGVQRYDFARSADGVAQQVAPSGGSGGSGISWCDACINRSGPCRGGPQNSCQVSLLPAPDCEKICRDGQFDVTRCTAKG